MGSSFWKILSTYRKFKLILIGILLLVAILVAIGKSIFK